MKSIVVGGHTREIGKTSVMAGLIRELRWLGWTAVKVTQYGHGVCSLDGEHCGCAPKEHPFVLSEEKNTEGGGDTSRFLAAGAKRSLWLRVRQGQLAEAFPLLERAWADDDWVMIESNSILRFLQPALYLFVLDARQSDFKTSALEFLERADALVPIESRMDTGGWPARVGRCLENKPVFPVPAGAYFSSDLSRFVLQRVLASDPLLRETDNSLTRTKEQPCQH